MRLRSRGAMMLYGCSDEQMTLDELRQRIRRSLEESARVPLSLIKELDGELARRPSADLWILRGDVIQLCDEGDADLDEARNSYLSAIQLHPGSADAYESLGHFTLAVEGDARRSVPYFQRALELGAGTSAAKALRAAIDDLDDRSES